MRQQTQYPLRVHRALLRHAVEFSFEKFAHETAGDRAFLDDEQLVVVKRRAVDRLGLMSVMRARSPPATIRPRYLKIANADRGIM